MQVLGETSFCREALAKSPRQDPSSCNRVAEDGILVPAEALLCSPGHPQRDTLEAFNLSPEMRLKARAAALKLCLAHLAPEPVDTSAWSGAKRWTAARVEAALE